MADRITGAIAAAALTITAAIVAHGALANLGWMP